MKWPRFIALRTKETRKYLIAILLLFVTFSFGAFAQARHFAQSQLYATGQGIQTLTRFVFHKKGNLQNEIDSLKQQVGELNNTLAQNSELTQENTELRAAIATIAARPTLFAQARTAYVTERASSARQHTLELNAGTQSGIKVDDIVTTTEGYLVGIIERTDENTSTVRLLQDSQSSVPVRILGTRNSEGLVRGQSGFVLELAFVPSAEELSENLTVVTNGLEGRFPPGLVIGSVTNVVTVDKDPFKKAQVKPFVDPRDLITVLVL